MGPAPRPDGVAMAGRPNPDRTENRGGAEGPKREDERPSMPLDAARRGAEDQRRRLAPRSPPLEERLIRFWRQAASWALRACSVATRLGMSRPRAERRARASARTSIPSRFWRPASQRAGIAS